MISTEKLTRTEILSLMEACWDTLSHMPEAIESPDWHAQALQEAEQAVALGTAQFIPWEQAKNALRQQHT